MVMFEQLDNIISSVPLFRSSLHLLLQLFTLIGSYSGWEFAYFVTTAQAQ